VVEFREETSPVLVGRSPKEVEKRLTPVCQRMWQRESNFFALFLKALAIANPSPTLLNACAGDGVQKMYICVQISCV